MTEQTQTISPEAAAALKAFGESYSVWELTAGMDEATRALYTQRPRDAQHALVAAIRAEQEARIAELEDAIRDVIHQVWSLGGYIDTDMDARLHRLVAEPWPDDDDDAVGGA